jgi:hypothetical protein
MTLIFLPQRHEGTKVSHRTVVRQPFVLLCAFVVKNDKKAVKK